jgi:DNA-binding IclR family transcriptional regulator
LFWRAFVSAGCAIITDVVTSVMVKMLPTRDDLPKRKKTVSSQLPRISPCGIGVHLMDYDSDPPPADNVMAAASPASQTLVRGLDVLEQVANGPQALSAIARRLGLSRSTVHRLAATLLERRYLNVTPRRGYSLGPKLLELGFLARDQISLVRLARPYVEALALQTGDVAVLAVRDRNDVIIADQAAGTRAVLPSLRTGDRLKLAGTLGRALTALDNTPIIDEGEPEVRIIAAPVRGADGSVRGALGIAAASVYADAAECDKAVNAVRTAANALGAELGWRVSGAHAKPSAANTEAAQVATFGQMDGTAGVART